MDELHYIDIDILYRKMASEPLSQEEEQTFEKWHAESDAHKKYYERFCAQQEKIMTGDRSAVDVRKGFHSLERKNRKRTLRLYVRRNRWVAAVILFLLIGGGAFLLQKEQAVRQPKHLAHSMGSHQAITLRLPMGQQLELDSLSLGRVIRKDSGVMISLSEEGLRYERRATKAERTLQYNELEVPTGGEFKVTLEDGTKVYLNSNTRLRYPVRFGGDERRVILEGEAYFEVAKSEMPFIVETALEEVTVFGTKFNIMAYENEDVTQTTLVEGSVGVRVKEKKNADFRKIKPGEQFRLNKESAEIDVVKVNVFPYVAWKDGLFVSQNDNLEVIMRKLERWFDVEVFYQNPGLKKKRFFGIMERQSNLQAILEIISEAGDVRFEMKGRTLVVSEK